MGDYDIANPCRRGDSILLPAGTRVRTTHPRKRPYYTLRRSQTVRVHLTFDGYVDTLNYFKRGNGFISLPTITWVGTGGYWCDAQLTTEVLRLNHLDVPKIPGEDALTINYIKLDYRPEFDGPNTDLWKKAS